MNTNSKRIPLVWLMTLGMVLFTGGYLSWAYGIEEGTGHIG